MDELFELVELLKQIGDEAAEAPPPQPRSGEEEGEARVDCHYYEVVYEQSEPPGDVHGLDSHTVVVEFGGASVIVATGALVGRQTAFVPGVQARWLGLRLNYRWRGDVPKGGRLYVWSEYLDRPFDVHFDLESARDEVRIHVEEALARAWDGGGVLVVDGPIFRAAAATEMEGEYGELYRAFIRRRAELFRGKRAVGVVKRLERSTYLSRCVGQGANDEVTAIRLLEGRPGYVGPVAVEAEGYVKWMYYAVVPAARGVRALRVEALDEELAAEAASWMAPLADAFGVPMPVTIADKLARRLNASIVKMLYAMSPVEPTYRGLEAVLDALRES
ncbi:MAG: DNA double-strand break repair nuclease NurA [Thermoproteus sp.]